MKALVTSRRAVFVQTLSVALGAAVFAAVCIAHAAGQDVARIEVPAPPGAHPWTHLDFRNASGEFQFAIVSDLTNGNRTAVFADAVRKLNLLRPEFVMSVGDFIEGYTRDTALIEEEWQTFEKLVAPLETPFFHVPGNHDITNPIQLEIWKRRFGPTYYHFVYRNVLFLVLNTEAVSTGGFGEVQESFVAKVLAANPQVRWALVFMHKPLWAIDGGRSWSKIDAMLKDRPFTVFAGHWHRYKKYVRDGKRYIDLGRTGAGLGSESPMTGGFDHITWVTMTDSGPRIANIQVDGVWDEDVVTEASDAILRPVYEGEAVQADAVFAEEDKLTKARTRLSVRNRADLPMTFQARFWQHPFLRPSRHAFRVVVPPKETHTFEIGLVADEPQPATDLEPVSLAWTIRYQPPQMRPLEVQDTLDLHVVPILPITRRETPVVVDGRLDEWKDLPIVCDRPESIREHAESHTGPQDCSFRFGLQYDDRYLYFAAAVTDDVLLRQLASSPVKRDWLKVLIDARHDPVRSSYVGAEDPNEFLIFQMAPSDDPAKPLVVGLSRMPAGVQVACIPVGTGLAAEIAVPASYLDGKQGGPWSRVRVNMAVTDFDDPNRDVSAQLWWKPRWLRTESYAGSGTFAKRAAD